LISNIWSKMRQDADTIVLKAINDNNMIFISAQPDTIYFQWQVSLYLYQFAKLGIVDRCYALFGYTDDGPSDYIKNLAQTYKTIKWYKDERKNNNYTPTIRPHILAKFFKENPTLGANVFYHDSDIFLIRLPRFNLMLGIHDNVGYLSDTISYIGYLYIKTCSLRYKTKYKTLPDLDIFYGMCEIMQIDPELVKVNEKNSGGAQYLLKDIDYNFWEECEIKCVQLYSYLCDYEKKYPISHHIQKWTTDMWVVLWIYWKQGKHTMIHKELDFSWATGTVADYNRLNIFHLAGITGDNCSDKFYKGKYTKQTVFDAYYINPNIFNHINKNNATYQYVNVIKEYMTNVYLPQKGLTNGTDGTHAMKMIKKDIQLFRLNTSNVFAGVYRRDDSKKCCNKSIWRSENKTFIIFWNTTNWTLTYSVYEQQIGIKCGGLASTQSDEPYDNQWNKPDVTITIP
jgi:hypothetical protein